MQQQHTSNCQKQFLQPNARNPKSSFSFSLRHYQCGRLSTAQIEEKDTVDRKQPVFLSKNETCSICLIFLVWRRRETQSYLDTESLACRNPCKREKPCEIAAKEKQQRRKQIWTHSSARTTCAGARHIPQNRQIFSWHDDGLIIAPFVHHDRHLSFTLTKGQEVHVYAQ